MKTRVPLLVAVLLGTLSVCVGAQAPAAGSSAGFALNRSRIVPRFVPGTELQLDGFRLVFPVQELFHGDLNGDGDASDEVLHVLNLTTFTLINVGLAPLPTPEETRAFRVEGRHLLCLVSEAQQASLDLNGDGDTADGVLHAHDLKTGMTTNLGVACQAVDFDLEGGLCAVLVNEQAQGSVDLDGNGSMLDSVPHVWSADTGVLTNLGVPAFTAQLAGAHVVYEASEVNGDLNGDGDQNDRVLHAHDPELQTTDNLGIATYSLGGFLPPLRPVVSETLVLQLVGELEQGGTDLNGDGDTLDRVLFVHDLETGVTTGTGHASRDYGPLALHAAGSRYAAFLVSEADDGGLDRNGDGDALDSVLFVFDRMTGGAIGTGLQAATLDFDAGRALFLVREASQGATDRNGDGDATDFVPHVHEAATSMTTVLPFAAQGSDLILGLPANPPRIRGGLAAFAVVEAAQGGTDLNGDADTTDRVLFVHDLAAGTTHDLSVAIPLLGVSFEPGAERLAFLADEASQGASDLNGDGDAQDAIGFTWSRAGGLLHNTRHAVLENDVRSPFELRGSVTCYLLEAGPDVGLPGILLQGRLRPR